MEWLGKGLLRGKDFFYSGLVDGGGEGNPFQDFFLPLGLQSASCGLGLVDYLHCKEAVVVRDSG